MKAELYMRTIKTKYIGPTNFRGSRISVCWGDKPSSGPIRFFHWNSDLSDHENHAQAARAFYEGVRKREPHELDGLRLEGGWTKDGACFVIRHRTVSGTSKELEDAIVCALNALSNIKAGCRDGATMGECSIAYERLAQAIATESQRN